MLTIFSIPKPFLGNIRIIQNNSLASWLRLKPTPEIILVGNEIGLEEVADRYKLRHLKEVRRTSLGTPILSDAFEKVQEIASHSILCYVNSDIIFYQDLITSVERVPFDKYLMAGRRWDIDVHSELDFSSANWQDELEQHRKSTGVLRSAKAIDYFVFTRKCSWQMPPFAVGRPRWDNWLLYRALSMNLPVIDATNCVTAIHQNHDYSHVKGGSGKTWEGPEAVTNAGLAGGPETDCCLWDATWRLRTDGLTHNRTGRYFLRSIIIWIKSHPRAYSIVKRIKDFTKF